MNNADIRLRIKELSMRIGITQKQIAEELNTSQAAISEIIAGKRSLTSGQIAKMVIRFGVNENWLLTGEGEMLKNTELPTLPAKGIPLIENMQANCGFIVGPADSAFMNDCVMVVLPGIIADFFLKASGHSMINRQDPTRTITDGALVACNHCSGKIIQWGDVYAVATVDGVFIKKLMPCEDEDYVICESYNDENPPFKLYKELIVDIAKVSKAFNTANF